MGGDQAVTAAVSDEVAAGEYTGGMVALLPAEHYLDRLAVDGGDPADQLHLTLAFLGDDVTGWPASDQRALVEEMREIASRRQPVEARVFAHAQFNPDSHDGRDPCAVYLIGDTAVLTPLRAEVQRVVERQDGVPEQHEPFIAHVTAGYGVEVGRLSYTGPVVFDRLRVALADEVTDLPFGEGDDVTEPADTGDDEGDEGLTAAVARTKGGSVKQSARDKATQSGHAMEDGSFPIEDGADLDNAIQSVGRAKDPEAARKHIIKQAKRLGLESKIPDSWRSDGTVTASAELDDTQRHAITAAALAMVKDLGPAGAYASAPLVFHDPARLAVADEVIELPDDDALIASAGDELPPAEWFQQPSEPFELGIHVDGGRVWGWLAEWNIPHIGASGQTIYPPRSASGYRWFHTKSARVQGPDGPERLNIGHITFGTGHAPTNGVDHLAAAAHYDNSGHRGAKVRVGEDEHGIWFAGALCAGVEGARLEEFEESDTSGDWRRIMGNLELVACLGVNVGGFPKIGMSLAASGEPLALVASGRAWGHPAAAVDVDAIAEAVVARWEYRQEQRALTAALTAEREQLLADLDDTAELAAQRDALLAAITGADDENDDDGGELVEVGSGSSDRYTW